MRKRHVVQGDDPLSPTPGPKGVLTPVVKHVAERHGVGSQRHRCVGTPDPTWVSAKTGPLSSMQPGDSPRRALKRLFAARCRQAETAAVKKEKRNEYRRQDKSPVIERSAHPRTAHRNYDTTASERLAWPTLYNARQGAPSKQAHRRIQRGGLFALDGNNRQQPPLRAPRPLMANSSQNARVRTEDDGADETSSRHPAISSASIESVKTTYDENPLLSIMKSTCAPNNTPVHTPSGSPSLQVQGGNDAKNDGDSGSKGKNVAAAAASFQVRRRNSDNAPHTAASPHAPSNTPSGVSSLCHSRPAQANVLQVSDAVRRGVIARTTLCFLIPLPPLATILPLLLLSAAPKKK